MDYSEPEVIIYPSLTSAQDLNSQQDAGSTFVAFTANSAGTQTLASLKQEAPNDNSTDQGIREADSHLLPRELVFVGRYHKLAQS